MAQLIQDCRERDTYFVCHKASIAGHEVCCRGFYDTQDAKLIRFAKYFNMIEFVDPTTGKPTEGEANDTGTAQDS